MHTRCGVLDGQGKQMIVQIQRTLDGGNSDQVLIRNEDWSVYWVGVTPEELRVWLGSRTMVFAEAHLTETGIGVDHAVADPRWPPSFLPSRVNPN
jgi:hypothetical protein